MKKNFDIAFLVSILLLLSVRECYAYIDPGTGSMIMTAILGVAAAGGYYIRKLFSRNKDSSSEDNDSEPEEKSGSNEE